MSRRPRHFERLRDAAGIENCTIHDLRHTFASHLAMKGVDLYTIAKLLGHSDIKMTQRYAHLAPDHKKIAVNMLDFDAKEQIAPEAEKLAGRVLA